MHGALLWTIGLYCFRCLLHILPFSSLFLHSSDWILAQTFLRLAWISPMILVAQGLVLTSGNSTYTFLVVFHMNISLYHLKKVSTATFKIYDWQLFFTIVQNMHFFQFTFLSKIIYHHFSDHSLGSPVAHSL